MVLGTHLSPVVDRSPYFLNGEGEFGKATHSWALQHMN